MKQIEELTNGQATSCQIVKFVELADRYDIPISEAIQKNAKWDPLLGVLFFVVKSLWIGIEKDGYAHS